MTAAAFAPPSEHAPEQARPMPTSALAPAGGSWPRLLGFRFGFLFAFQLVFPFPLGVIPRTEWLAEILARPWEWAVRGGAALLGVTAPANVANGSGDTSFAYALTAVMLVVAALGAAVWTSLDRRRPAHPRLATAMTVGLRYYLAFTMISYGVAKLSQFPAPGPMRLDERVGDMSPMGMLWTFMGSSQAYALFGGAAEILAGALLLSRRTAVLGALVAVATLTNIVALNFCYDVPVKLFSTELLLMAVVIVLPHARRLVAAALGQATAATPSPAPLAPRWARLWLAARLALLGGGAYQLYQQVEQSLEWRTPTQHELAGSWIVDRHLVAGADLAATETADRWHRVALDAYGARITPLAGAPVLAGLSVDAAADTMSFRSAALGLTITDKLRYTLDPSASPPTLVLEGTWRDRPLRVELHRDGPSLLMTRGFRWVNEYPFNR